METWTEHCLHEFVVNVCTDILQFIFHPFVTHASSSTSAAAVGGRGCVVGLARVFAASARRAGERHHGSHPLRAALDEATAVVPCGWSARVCMVRGVSLSPSG